MSNVLESGKDGVYSGLVKSPCSKDGLAHSKPWGLASFTLRQKAGDLDKKDRDPGDSGA